jgi:DTW domain-containing protein YfiP
LIHPQEAKKVRNGTGRLAHLALSNSEIFTGLDFSTHPNVQALLSDEKYNPFILYPGKTSKDISEYDPEQLSKNDKIPLVFVIDGTWKAAKKMMKMSQNLHDLPQISISPKEPSRFLIKQQPNSLCLSTIEAIFFLLKELEKKGLENLAGRHENLLAILDQMVKIQLAHINDSTAHGYRKKDGTLPREKVFSKKPHKVSPFFL